MQKYHDEPKQYKGYLKSALIEPPLATIKNMGHCPNPRAGGWHGSAGWQFTGEFRRSMQHEPRMEVSWCEDVARV